MLATGQIAKVSTNLDVLGFVRLSLKLSQVSLTMAHYQASGPILAVHLRRVFYFFSSAAPEPDHATCKIGLASYTLKERLFVSDALVAVRHGFQHVALRFLLAVDRSALALRWDLLVSAGPILINGQEPTNSKMPKLCSP